MTRNTQSFNKQTMQSCLFIGKLLYNKKKTKMETNYKKNCFYYQQIYILTVVL